MRSGPRTPGPLMSSVLFTSRVKVSEWKALLRDTHGVLAFAGDIRGESDPAWLRGGPGWTEVLAVGPVRRETLPGPDFQER